MSIMGKCVTPPVYETIVRDDPQRTAEETQKELSICQRFSYSVGHVLNDLTASVWFTYILIYFQDVAGFGSVVAGNLILVGQVTDALCNPLVGLISDSDKNRCIKRCGRRRRWHVIGTLAVAVSFPLILIQCPGCSNESPLWVRLLYYIPLVVIFQFGWASAQISHLALIPELSPSEKGRLELNALRYGWTVLSNIIVYGIAWVLFGTAEQQNARRVGESDSKIFQTLGLSVVGIGLFACVLFYAGTKDPSAESNEDDPEVNPNRLNSYRRTRNHWINIIKDIRFYTCTLLYMSARLIVNLTQVYVPFFVTHTLDLDKYTIATYPLVTCIFSFITAVLIKFIARRCSSKMLYFWGCLNVIGASLWMAFLQPHLEVATFGTAVLSGMGGAAIMVTSLSIVSELIGTNTENGAFVFGAMGFADKLANGVAVFAIQTLNPCEVSESDETCTRYIRYIISIVPGVVAGVSLVVVALVAVCKGKAPVHRQKNEDEVALLG